MSLVFGVKILRLSFALRSATAFEEEDGLMLERWTTLVFAGGIFKGGGKGGGNAGVDVGGRGLFCVLFGAGLAPTFEAPVLTKGHGINEMYGSEERSGLHGRSIFIIEYGH